MSKNPQIAVIADDLTGALDAIAPFACKGLRCVVATAPDLLAASLLHAADVIAVSTNSRELPPTDAAKAVRLAAALLAAVPVIFKKIDSRLKGNIAAEVAALAEVLQLETVLLCPAIPEMGRTVVGGQLCGFGVDVPLDVAAVFAGHDDLSVLVPDVQIDAEIDAMLEHLPKNILLVGARGLSAALARRLGGAAEAPVTLPLPHPIAFAIGSRDPITLAQVEDLRRHQPTAAWLAAPNGDYSGPAPAAALAIMQVVSGDEIAEPAAVTSAFSASFCRVLATGRACLVLTGGETAAAVLAQMRIGMLQVLGEVSPGLPLCKALDFPDAPLIVAKSGGFGATNVLSLLVDPISPAARLSDAQG